MQGISKCYLIKLSVIGAIIIYFNWPTDKLSAHSSQADHSLLAPRTIKELRENVTANNMKTSKKSTKSPEYERPVKISTYNNFWQVVNGNKVIKLFSAFYDSRQGMDKNYIRIIAVAEYTNFKPIHCLYWYSKTDNPKKTTVSVRDIGAAFSVKGKPYGQYLFSCEHDKTGPYPLYVSITMPNFPKATTYLKVQYPERPVKKIEFGLCMSVAYWEQDPYRIVEWLEIHKLWGVEEVNIYNSSLDPDAVRVYEHYASKGFVNLRQAPIPVEDDGETSILLTMSISITDCMYRNLYRYKKVVVVDIDEMIVPAKHDNYTDLLKAIDKAKAPTHPAPSYMFRNAYFFEDFGESKSDPWFLATPRFIKRVDISPPGYSVKSITDPRVCIGMQNHRCWSLIKMYDNSKWNIEVSPTFGKSQHYKKCHFDRYLKKPGSCSKMMKSNSTDRTALRFEKELEKRVRMKLTEMRLPLKRPKDKGKKLKYTKYKRLY